MPSLKSQIGNFLVRKLGMSRRSLNVLRHEFRALRIACGNTFHPRKRRAIRKLRQSRELSVNIGSGGFGLPDWVNVDIAPGKNTTILLDIRKTLPFVDGSVRRILAEHVVEHLDFDENIPSVFAEFYRVLAPGGVVRIVVPDTERFVLAYSQKSRDLWQGLGWDLDTFPPGLYSSMHVLNHIFHQEGEHLFGYDFETMALTLRKAGFPTVERRAFRVSADPALMIDQELHKPYSLYVEAIK